MTKISDLRSYITALEEAGQLARIKKQVDLTYELADVAATLVRTVAVHPYLKMSPVLPGPFFAAAWPIKNGQRLPWVALSMKSSIIWSRCLILTTVLILIKVDKAGWMANVKTGDEVDVGQLPIPTHSRGDGGAFITGGVIISKDPISGRGNLSYNRMLRMGPRNFGFNVNEWRHVRQFMESRDDPHAPYPIAIAIGLDPAVMIAAGVRTEMDELTDCRGNSWCGH